MYRNVVILCLAVILILPSLIIINSIINEDLVAQDKYINLSQAEEQDLKRQLNEEGVLKRAYRSYNLTDEQKQAYDYLTRTVQATSEADPQDIYWHLVVYFKRDIPSAQITEFLSQYDCTIVKNRNDAYFLRFPDIINRHEQIFKQLAGGDIVTSVGTNPFLISEAQIRKNLVAVEFESPLSNSDLEEFQRDNELVLIYQTDYPRSDGNKRYLFFIMSDVKLI